MIKDFKLFGYHVAFGTEKHDKQFTFDWRSEQHEGHNLIHVRGVTLFHIGFGVVWGKV